MQKRDQVSGGSCSSVGRAGWLVIGGLLVQIPELHVEVSLSKILLQGDWLQWKPQRPHKRDKEVTDNGQWMDGHQVSHLLVFILDSTPFPTRAPLSRGSGWEWNETSHPVEFSQNCQTVKHALNLHKLDKRKHVLCFIYFLLDLVIFSSCVMFFSFSFPFTAHFPSFFLFTCVSFVT